MSSYKVQISTDVHSLSAEEIKEAEHLAAEIFDHDDMAVSMFLHGFFLEIALLRFDKVIFIKLDRSRESSIDELPFFHWNGTGQFAGFSCLKRKSTK